MMEKLRSRLLDIIWMIVNSLTIPGDYIAILAVIIVGKMVSGVLINFGILLLKSRVSECLNRTEKIWIKISKQILSYLKCNFTLCLNLIIS